MIIMLIFITGKKAASISNRPVNRIFCRGNSNLGGVELERSESSSRGVQGACSPGKILRKKEAILCNLTVSAPLFREFDTSLKHHYRMH
jgi:hypothetical protein